MNVFSLNLCFFLTQDSIQNGSSHTPALPVSLFERLENSVKVSTELLPPLPVDGDHLPASGILDLDDMTANELCGDIAGTPQIFGLTEMDLVGTIKGKFLFFLRDK